MGQCLQQASAECWALASPGRSPAPQRCWSGGAEGHGRDAIGCLPHQHCSSSLDPQNNRVSQADALFHFTAEETEAPTGEATGTTRHLHPSRDQSYSLWKVPAVLYLLFSKGDFLTQGGICILGCREVNICMEGKKGNSFGLVRTQGLRAPLLPAGRARTSYSQGCWKPLPGYCAWPGTVTWAFRAVSSLLPEYGLCRVQHGGTTVVLEARHSVPVHPQQARCCAGQRAEGRGQPPGPPHCRVGPSPLAGVEWDAGFWGWCQILSLGHFLGSKGLSRSVDLDCGFRLLALEDFASTHQAPASELIQ